MGEIHKIIFYNDKIYISDSRKAKAVFIYNKKGELLSTINRIGRGAEEYTSLADFNIDKLTQNIYILDSQLRKILIYDDNGVFLKDIKLDFIASSFLIMDKYIVFDKFNMMERNQNGMVNNNILMCNRMGKIINSFLSIDKDLQYYSMGPINGLKEKNNNTISYLPPISNYIYTFDINQNRLINQLHIDFGKNWPKPSLFKKKVHPAKIVNLMTDKNLINFLNYSENSNFMCFGFYRGKDKIIGFVSKNDQTYNFYNANEAIFELLPLSVDNDGNFVNVIYPEAIENWEKFELSVPENVKNSKSTVLIKYSLK